MISPFDRLSKAELKMFRAYISAYDTNYEGEQEHSGDYNHSTANDSYLLRFWNSNKYNLAELFDDGLRFSIPVEVKKMRGEVNFHPLWQTLFYKKLCEICQNKYSSDFTGALCNSALLDLWGFIHSSDSIYENIYHGCSFTINKNDFESLKNIPGPDSLTIPNGIKYSRAMKKLADFFNLSSIYNEWNLEHSRILNDKTMSGDLVFSIHPMDYITMSDGTFNSCMSWTSGSGCYRAGTVEMMNSPFAIVVYFNSHQNIRWWNWDNNIREETIYEYPAKRWRTLVLVDPTTFICSVKAYPYQHEELTKIALRVLKDKCENVYGITFKDNAYTNGRDGFYSDYIEISGCDGVWDLTQYIHFNTDDAAMYCDFGCARHWCYISNNFTEAFKHLSSFDDDSVVYHINYSGENECMNCGCLKDYYEEGCESAVLCSYCMCPSEDVYYCVDCENRVYVEDINWTIDGEPLCLCCWNNRMDVAEREARERLNRSTGVFDPVSTSVAS